MRRHRTDRSLCYTYRRLLALPGSSEQLAGAGKGNGQCVHDVRGVESSGRLLAVDAMGELSSASRITKPAQSVTATLWSLAYLRSNVSRGGKTSDVLTMGSALSQGLAQTFAGSARLLVSFSLRSPRKAVPTWAGVRERKAVNVSCDPIASARAGASPRFVLSGPRSRPSAGYHWPR